VFVYLGSVRALQNEADAAIKAYEQATLLNPDDRFAKDALSDLRKAKTLQPVPVAVASDQDILQALQQQPLHGYDRVAVPASLDDISIGVVATGISPQLARALGSRLKHSFSTVPDERDTDDALDHGTSVIALAAALAPNAQIVSIKALSRDGSGGGTNIAEGIRAAVRLGAQVLILPLGSRTPIKEVDEAVAEAVRGGALVVAAAGNGSSDQPTFPGRLPGVTAVGAVDARDRQASFTDVGPEVVYAPGVDILVLGPGGKLVKQSGTSFSATIAAAIAAIVWGTRPTWSAKQVRDALTASAVDLGEVDPNNPALGKLRRIDMKAALARPS
jgi:subtilisin family serine protease